jgi:dynein heavy chain
MIKKGMEDGNWVLLQNCHLFKSWMGSLEGICAELNSREKYCSPDFKLILTSMPVSYFPISVLQNSLKMTTDPPKGIKANLRRTYSNIITEEIYDEPLIKQRIEEAGQTQYSGMTGQSETIDKVKIAEKRRAFKNLLFSLAFFHAVALERRKFGPLGWNIMYEFSDADLITSITMLKNFMQDNNEIPWDSIKFMTGQINYGGRVTDFLDNVLLMSILQIY